MKTKIIILLSFTFWSYEMFSQENETIVADRPGASTGPFVMTPKKFQIETGVYYSKEQNSNNSILSLNNTLLRYGSFKFAELRLSTDFVKVTNDKAELSGFSPPSLGTKLKLCDNNGLVPSTGILINVSIPFLAKKEFQTNNMASSYFLLFENELSEKISIGTNVAVIFDGESTNPSYFTALCVPYQLTQDLSIFMENYNLFSKTEFPVFCFDTGLAYIIKNKIQLDVSFDLGLHNRKINQYIINSGFSYLF